MARTRGALRRPGCAPPGTSHPAGSAAGTYNRRTSQQPGRRSPPRGRRLVLEQRGHAVDGALGLLRRTAAEAAGGRDVDGAADRLLDERADGQPVVHRLVFVRDAGDQFRIIGDPQLPERRGVRGCGGRGFVAAGQRQTAAPAMRPW
jgi:hypothetical protein